MGKVLSVGQHPLKIPFIGYIGVWINEGLNSLSEPTSPKGSLSFMGIFAPLTISIVVLVVFIFIYPERGKTNKEKIRFNILGVRSLKLKKTIISFLIVYIVFLTVIHCFANESISASVGVNASSPDSSLDFGRIRPGRKSFIQVLPVINPSTMPVKGVVFGRGEVSDFITRETFEIERGESLNMKLNAVAGKGTQNGSYLGEIMVYSSPFWLIFPEDFMRSMVEWNAEATVFILGFLIALILTTITMTMLVSITLVDEGYRVFTINRSMYHSSRIILKEGAAKKFSRFKRSIKRSIGKNLAWILKINLSEIKSKKETKFSSIGKPMIAALVIIPIIFFLQDVILAMFISVLIAGTLAYVISCKKRSKIVLAVAITMVIAITHMAIQSNLVILSKEQTTVEIMALALGALGIYLLLLTLLLIPLAILSWFIVHVIRNVKERKDPLLTLEGSCDL